MVKKSAASGNGGGRRGRTSAAAVAQEGSEPAAVQWGGGALPLNPPATGMEAGASADNGFTTDTASGAPVVEAPPKRGRKAHGRKAKEAPASDTLSNMASDTLSNMASDLVAGVERLERLAEEVGALKDDAKEVMAEMTSKGYSASIIREAIRRRSMDPDKRAEHDSLLSIYEEALRGA